MALNREKKGRSEPVKPEPGRSGVRRTRKRRKEVVLHPSSANPSCHSPPLKAFRPAPSFKSRILENHQPSCPSTVELAFAGGSLSDSESFLFSYHRVLCLDWRLQTRSSFVIRTRFSPCPTDVDLSSTDPTSLRARDIVSPQRRQPSYWAFQHKLSSFRVFTLFILLGIQTKLR